MTTEFKINISGTAKNSVVDGPGLRFTIFTQGCWHNCEGCHNQQTHSKEGGYEITLNELAVEISRTPNVDGVTFSGGEPLLWTDEILGLTYLLKALNPNLNYVLYTGYNWKEIQEKLVKDDPRGSLKELIGFMDFIIDGRFIQDNPNGPNERFKGSANQTVYAIHKDPSNFITPYIDNNWETYSELKK